MDLVSAAHTFLRIASTGSISAVAQEKGRTQSAISRQLAALEDQLQVRLFNRTTAGLSLTDDAETLLPFARQLLDCADAFGEAARARQGRIAGAVRLSVPSQLGVFLSSQLGPFLEAHPAIKLELLLRDDAQDLVSAGIDLEVRVGETADSSLIRRKLGQTTAYLVASPAYVEKAGEPRSPSEIETHTCLTHARAGYQDVWWFIDGDGPIQVRVPGRFHAESAYAVREAALAGSGIAVLSHLLVQDDIAQGRLVALMPQYPLARFPIFAVYPSQINLPLRVRVLIEFLAALLADDKEMM